MNFAIIFVVAFCFASIQCIDDCASRECPQVPKHYEELGCKEIRENGDCCATRFGCPDFANYDSSKCHYKGKQYNVGDTLGDNEVSETVSSCGCRNWSNRVEFHCAENECGDTGGDNEERWRCHSIFRNATSLCPDDQICDESEIAKLAKCYVDGEVYRLGQQFYPQSQGCYSCLCTDDYENTTVIAENVNCVKVDCSIELLDLNDIRRGCVPIYGKGEIACCPGIWGNQCPTGDDRLKTTDITDNSVGATCTFGKLTLRIGQQLHLDEKCIECECTIPPMITCTHRKNCWKYE